MRLGGVAVDSRRTARPLMLRRKASDTGAGTSLGPSLGRDIQKANKFVANPCVSVQCTDTALMFLTMPSQEIPHRQVKIRSNFVVH
jgi:hypothetical protein